MKSPYVYSRKVSSEESREGYLMVLKDRLAFFPPIGQSFELVRNGTARPARVECYDCTCRGPELPHQHYFIKLDGLRKGDVVTIIRDPRKPGRYELA